MFCYEGVLSIWNTCSGVWIEVLKQLNAHLESVSSNDLPNALTCRTAVRNTNEHSWKN